MKITKSLIVLLVLTCGSLRAEEAEQAEQTVEVAVVDPNSVLDQLRKDLNGIQAEFIQFEITEGQQQSDLNAGIVWMQAPDRFRWHYQDPYEQLIVADGTNVWVYDEDLEQVTVKQQNNELNPIYVLINAELSKKHYEIKYEAKTQGVDWISLTPKAKSEEVKQVWLGIKNNELRQIKVSNYFDQTMVFRFSAIQRNPEFTEGLFQFDVPEGVDVIRAMEQ